MINTIVFDMGGVIMDYDPYKLIGRYPELSKEDANLLAREIFCGEGWVRLDYGLHTVDEFFESIKSNLPERLHGYAEKLLYHWYEPTIPIPGTAEVIKELKAKGYRLYLLSNAGVQHDTYWPMLLGSEYFDGKVVSAFEKKWKPNEDFYQILFDRFNVNPNESIFIDDKQENIDTGKKLGMDCIVFTDAESLRKELKKRNIL